MQRRVPKLQIATVLLVLLAASIALAQGSRRRGQRGSTLGPSDKITGGYVLTHEHPTQGMAFGGNYAFAGEPGNYKNGIMERGYTAECGGCRALGNCDHGEVKGSIAGASGALGRDMGDHNSHMGPSTNSFSHLRYSTEWVKEAFRPSERRFQDTRMKVFVALAVESEGMCEQLYYVNKGHGGPGGDGYRCQHGDSFDSLRRQLNNLRKWAVENSSWMEIAYTAADARRIANSKKLVVILGIESEYSFGAEDRVFDPVARLNRYYDLGVRTFYLAHKINSRLAGADIFRSKNSTAGKLIRSSQAIAGCFFYDDNVGTFPLVGGNGHMYCDSRCGPNQFRGEKPLDRCRSRLGEISEVNMADYSLGKGASVFNGFARYPLPPGFVGSGGTRMEPFKDSAGRVIENVERNNLGLSHDGERVVREAMMKGMIISIDHVSSNARRDIEKISRQSFGDYPLNAMHNNPNEMLAGDNKPDEYDFDKGERDIVRTTGGFFGVRVGPVHSRPYPDSGITVECPKTSTETAKILASLLDEGLSVGYSLDFSTITEGVHSRTYESCSHSSFGPDAIHKYDRRHVAEGLSHVGMMKRWHRELQRIGLKRKYLRQLRNDGAEQFISMWERSEAKSSLGSQIPRQTFERAPGSGHCNSHADCASTEFCGKPVVGARTCKPLHVHGQSCTYDEQCSTGRCNALLKCADADECQSTSDCNSDQYCGDPVLGKRQCKTLLSDGQRCASANQCASGRCFLTHCAAADECQRRSDCNSGEYCGDPIAGARSCKTLKSQGAFCGSAKECASGRCSAGTCGAADECQANGDCGSGEYCGDPVAGNRTCKALKAHGETCNAARQCATGRCSWGWCADADECRENTDCNSSQYCGDPISGRRKCKDLKSRGQPCTTGRQCASGRCRPSFTCK